MRNIAREDKRQKAGQRKDKRTSCAQNENSILIMNPDEKEDSIGMDIGICLPNQLKELMTFQEKYLSAANTSVFSSEFSCPLGLRAAVKRKEVIAAVKNDKIIGMLRFYFSKRHGHISLYQFAIDENNRRNNLLTKMLSKTGNNNILSRCPLKARLNDYFSKTGWTLKFQDKQFKYWQIILCKNETNEPVI